VAQSPEQGIARRAVKRNLPLRAGAGFKLYIFWIRPSYAGGGYCPVWSCYFRVLYRNCYTVNIESLWIQSGRGLRSVHYHDERFVGAGSVFSNDSHSDVGYIN